MPEPLPAADLEVLAFEREWWKYEGAKETAVRERFGCSLTRYYQRLNRILLAPAAELYDAELVRRLRRLREQRAQARGARRPGWSL